MGYEGIETNKDAMQGKWVIRFLRIAVGRDQVSNFGQGGHDWNIVATEECH